jgi:tetraacyldisaccharide 4'-kinase
MEQRLTRLWYGDGTEAAPLLRGLSWIYGAVVRVRSRAYAAHWLSSQPAGKPVIVVGNLTVGGTGKTPLVAWLAQRLSQLGLQVGIVSRGYGGWPPRRSYDEPHLVAPDSSWREVGDEPLLLRRRTGCLTMVGRERVAAARALVAHGVDVIVADDGLQHLQLARDCEIVVVDGSRGFGNGRLLPAGPLREPASRAERVDVTVVNGLAEHRSLEQRRPGVSSLLTMTMVAGNAHRVDDSASERPLESFRGERAHAVAGIGNPSRFFRDLRERGIEIVEHAFADHHPFAERDLEFGDTLPVLMTEKDAVRCREFASPRLWYVPISAQLGEPQERELLERVLRKTGLAAIKRG